MRSFAEDVQGSKEMNNTYLYIRKHLADQLMTFEKFAKRVRDRV